VSIPLCECGDPESAHIPTKEDVRCWKCFMAGRPLCFKFRPVPPMQSSLGL
jgi:hypothetical protein